LRDGLSIEATTPFMLSIWDFIAPPTAIVARAKQESRTVITADLDYPRLLAVARASEPSLILFRNGDWTEDQVRTRLGDILAGLTERDIAQSIIVVDRDRVRRRRLPIE
jgi:predicted nuclease of predicted toxin-antitoxin system